MWILIVIMIGGGNTTSMGTAEFNTPKACIEAQNLVKSSFHGYERFHTVKCVYKGDLK